MDWFLFIISLISTAGIIWCIRFFFIRKLKKIGPIVCWWYTVPAISGIGIMCAYTITGFYLFFTTYKSAYISLCLLGFIMLAFYFFFGRAAIGSSGFFSGGHIIPWKAIYDYRLTEKWGNRLRWQFRWRVSPAAAGDRQAICVIPASCRSTAEEVIRNTIHIQSDGLKKETD